MNKCNCRGPTIFKGGERLMSEWLQIHDCKMKTDLDFFLKHKEELKITPFAIKTIKYLMNLEKPNA